VGKDGEEAFVRRDSMQLRGEGLIGLGKAPDSNSSQVIRYACEE
jgi:adenylate cyclase